MKEYKLQFELVPDGCWYSNLRTLLPAGGWDIIRKKAYARANGRCEICGAPKRYLDAHEQWEYDDEKGVQRLKNVIAVCKDCHAVIHIGRTQLKGDEERAAQHFMRVNNCTYAEYRAALGEANRVHRLRSERGEWLLDISDLPRFL